MPASTSRSRTKPGSMPVSDPNTIRPSEAYDQDADGTSYDRKPHPDDPDFVPLDAMPPSDYAGHTARHAPPQSETTPSGPADASLVGTQTKVSLEDQADHLKNMSIPCALYGSLFKHNTDAFDPFAYRLLVDRFLAEMAPTNPIERMMAEQLLLTHHVFAHLNMKAMIAQHADAAKIYLSAAARFMSEFRLTAIAIRGIQSTSPVENRSASDQKSEPEVVTPPTSPSVQVPGDGATATPDWITKLRSKRAGNEVFHADLCPSC